MLSLSHTTGYAALALGCISSWKGEWVLSTQIHKCTGVPMPYLRKMLFALGKAGLIRAKRGYQGGFVLARSPKEITLLEVAQAVEHQNPVPECLLGLPGCSEATPCPMRPFWQKERARIETKLGRITIAKAAQSVLTARWGKLVSCPPEEDTPSRPESRPATRRVRRVSGPGTAKRKKARPTRRKRS